MYDNYSPALFGIISRTLQDDKVAEETLHDVFLKIWNQIDQYDASKGTLFTWMYRIARNQAIDVRRSKAFKAGEKSNDIEDYVNVFESAKDITDHLGIRELLGQIGDECNRLIQSNFFMGYSHVEISKKTGLPLGTVKTRLRNCLKQLRELLKGDFE